MLFSRQSTPNGPDTSSFLENLYQIDHDVLIDYQGKKHPKIPYATPLHEDLAFVLKDPEQADIIQKAYSCHILPHLPEEMKESFSKALLKVCVLFGSLQFSPKNSLIKAVKEENRDLLEWFGQHQELLEQFCKIANIPARAPLSLKKDPPFYTIALLTTSASGGNYAVAQAFESFLSSTKHMRPILIDVEKIARKWDLLMRATGAMTFDGVYADLFQQANQGKAPLKKRDTLSKQIGKYIPSCLGLQLKELMRRLQPDLIISTRSYTMDDIPLCTLGIPFRMFHSDYELSSYLMGLYGKIDPEMLRFWLPSLKPRIFRPLFLKNNRMDLYDEQDEPKTLMGKIAQITEEPQEIIEKQFELLGYPLRKEINRIDSFEKREDLRKKWNILPTQTPILVSMGRNGAGILEEIFDQLAKSEKEDMKYLFALGTNAQLKEKLSRKAGSSKRFAFYGLLSSQQWNELLNICPVTISKAGGAMVSEVLRSSTYLLILHSYLWEEANGSVLEQMGAGHKADLSIPLCQQVEYCLKNPRTSFVQNNDWEKRLLDHLRSIFHWPK